MAALSCHVQETVTTRSVVYKKEFRWEIEKFEDWWSSREITKSERLDNDNVILVLEEELQYEIPRDRSKSSTSPVITFEVEGIEHQFKFAILKYDYFDRYDEDHSLMMSISLYYVGPLESIIFKPLFYLRNGGTDIGNPLKAKQLKKGQYSDSKIFSSNNLMSNLESVLEDGRFLVSCLAQINILHEFSQIRSLENQVLSKKTWNQYLLEDFDFSFTTSMLDQFSDFEIICEDELESGDKYEKKFRCHKLVLVLGSKYYKKMLLGNFKEKQDKSTTVTDVSSHTMAKVLQYLYTGQVNNSEIDTKLLLAADKYELEHLQAVCELELGRKITIGTASEIVLVADACGSQIFKRYVYDFVWKYWKHMDSSDQAELLNRNPETLAELLNRS